MVTERDRRYLAEGKDPDPRFTLANERTFLAWIRTSLALVAAGIGVEAFVEDLPAVPRRILASLLLLLGGWLAISAHRRWRTAEHALRNNESLPLPGMTALVAIGVAMTAVALLVLVLFAG